MRPSHRNLLRSALLLFVIVGAALIIRTKRATLANAPRDTVGPLPVRVATARSGTLPLTRDYVAIVESQRSTDVAARLTARVLSVAVREGDTVAADSVLAVLQSNDLQTALDAVAAQAAAAESERGAQQATLAALETSRAFFAKEWERVRNLHSGSAATDQQVDAARERFDDANGRLDAARLRLEGLRQAVTAARARQHEAELRITEDSRVVSGVDGIVTARRVEPGDLATPGRTLFVVSSPSLRLAFDVPQDDAPALQTGQTVQWPDPPPGGTTTLTRVHPSLSAARMRRVEADLPEGRAASLAMGAYLPVSVLLGQTPTAAVIPADALVTAPDARSFVFVVQDGRLRAQPVERLARHDDDVAVLGLASNAMVVVNTYLGWTALSSGRPAEVVP